MTDRVGIIGYPVRHSLSPRFQQAAFDSLDLDARYEAWETPAEDLRERVESLRAAGCLGANVTVPHKQAVLPLVDELDEEARLVGAVNTIVNRGGRLVGYNTDGTGFLEALDAAGFSPVGTGALVLGAGGAARAVCFALVRLGVQDLFIANRTPERATYLEDEVNALAPVAEAVPFTEEGIREILGDFVLVVNTTSVGMLHTGTEEQSPYPESLLMWQLFVNDLVYNPPETRLLRKAREAGARTLGGLPMLVRQGAAAFRLWTGKPPPVEVMERAAGEGLNGESSGGAASS